ncbi:MAG: hypothetical protein ABSE58_09830 [Candidatus Limnocylindrales bacterium]|jgi:hypothetical protein
MESDGPKRRGMRSYTVAALLGLFVMAAVVALVSRLLPGSASGVARRLLRGHRNDREG